ERAAVGVVERVLRASGVHIDLESAVYRADNRIGPSETVELARKARAARPSIYGDDAVAGGAARAGPRDAARPPVPLLPARLRGGVRRQPRGHGHVVRARTRRESRVLGALGAGRARSPRRLAPWAGGAAAYSRRV